MSVVPWRWKKLNALLFGHNLVLGQIRTTQFFPLAVPIPFVDFHSRNVELDAEIFNLLIAPIRVLLELRL